MIPETAGYRKFYVMAFVGIKDSAFVMVTQHGWASDIKTIKQFYKQETNHLD